jgi:hypothetical protein
MILIVLGILSALALTVLPAQDYGSDAPEKCWVTPYSISNGHDSFTVKGSGFERGRSLSILVGGAWLMATSDARGGFSVSDYATFPQTGTQTVEVYRSSDSKMSPLATCIINVR